jgi:hypothetical protein
MSKLIACPFKNEEASSHLANYLTEGTRENLTLADNRYQWYEAIRDYSDPLMTPGRKFEHPPLTAKDFLGEYPSNLLEERQNRLTALKERIESQRIEENKKYQEEEKRKRFVRGLLG